MSEAAADFWGSWLRTILGIQIHVSGQPATGVDVHRALPADSGTRNYFLEAQSIQFPGIPDAEKLELGRYLSSGGAVIRGAEDVCQIVDCHGFALG